MKTQLMNLARNIFDRLFDSQVAEKRKSKKRENLQKNFVVDEDDVARKNSKELLARNSQSMKDSQGVSDFSGSGYNGPGNVDREKTNSNMSQRNFGA